MSFSRTMAAHASSALAPVAGHGEGGEEGVGLLLDVEGVQGDGELSELLDRRQCSRTARARRPRSFTSTDSLATRFIPSKTAFTTSTSKSL